MTQSLPITTLSVSETAALLGVFSSTVVRWINADLFPGAYKLNPSASNSPYRVPQAALDAFLERRRTAIEILENA